MLSHIFYTNCKPLVSLEHFKKKVKDSQGLIAKKKSKLKKHLSMMKTEMVKEAQKNGLGKKQKNRLLKLK